MLVAIYVDDLLITLNNPKWDKELKKGLANEIRIKDLGEAKYCLRTEFKQENGEINMCQRRYVEELSEKFGMKICTPQHAPASPTSMLKASIDPNISTKNPKYRELVGSLMYLAVATRSDIAHTVSVLSQFNERPTEEHWGAAKRVLRYSKGTPRLGLTFRNTPEKIVEYSDAD